MKEYSFLQSRYSEEEFLEGIYEITELQGFLDGLTKSYMCEGRKLLKNKDLKKYNSYPSEDDNYLITRLLLDRVPATDKEIGKLLGYYPMSCNLYSAWHDVLERHYLVINGIRFNTVGLDIEALLWCVNTYAETCLKYYGYFYFYFSHKLSCLFYKNTKMYILENEADIARTKTILESFLNKGVNNFKSCFKTDIVRDMANYDPLLSIISV